MNDLLKEKIFALLDTLPRCNGPWVSGSGGHAVFKPRCGKFAKWVDGNWSFCEQHLPKLNGELHPSCKYIEELDHVEAAENLLFHIENEVLPPQHNELIQIKLDKYLSDNLLWLLTLVSLGYLPGTHTGDWVVELMYKLAPSGKITDYHRPNVSVNEFVSNIIKNIIE